MSQGKPLGDPFGNPFGLARSGGTVSAIGTITTRTTGPAANELPTDGRQLLKADYSKLYAAIGDAYSIADFTAGFTAVTLSASSTWSAIAYGNGVFVAISAAGLTSVSADLGATWQGNTNLPSGVTWAGITFGNGIFVAVGNGGISATSTDGFIWTAGTMVAPLPWRSVAYGGGRFVAISNSNTFTSFSTDGLTWTRGGDVPSATWQSITYGNGTFVAVAAASFSSTYSTDGGATWKITAISTSQQSWSSVAYGNGMFVAVATNNSTTVAFSPDGKAWVAGGGGMPAVASWNSVVFAAGTFVALATNQAAISTNGVSWQLMAVQPINRNFAASAFAAGVLVGVPSGDNTATRANVTSPTTFNLPKTIPLDNRSTAYIKVA